MRPADLGAACPVTVLLTQAREEALKMVCPKCSMFLEETFFQHQKLGRSTTHKSLEKLPFPTCQGKQSLGTTTPSMPRDHTPVVPGSGTGCSLVLRWQSAGDMVRQGRVAGSGWGTASAGELGLGLSETDPELHCRRHTHEGKAEPWLRAAWG